jgi:hypothetical protein
MEIFEGFVGELWDKNYFYPENLLFLKNKIEGFQCF